VNGSLHVIVESLWGDVGLVRPSDRRPLDEELAEVLDISQRLEDSAKLKQIGKVHVGREPIRKP
jgi:hypothetical protein